MSKGAMKISISGMKNSEVTTQNQLNDIMKDMDLARKDQTFFRELWYCLQPCRIVKVGGRGPFGRGATKHRLFWINPELNDLCRSTGKAEKVLPLSSVKEVRVGKKTDKFKSASVSAGDKLCLSVIYTYGKNPLETLDVVFSSEKEALRWKGVLDYLIEEKLTKAAKETMKIIIRQNFVFDTSVKLDYKDAEQNFDKLESYAVGWGQWGQNGLGPERVIDISLPEELNELPGVLLNVACGWCHSVFHLREEKGDSILQCGGLLGTHMEYDTFVPTSISNLPRVKIESVACGSFHSTALTCEGDVLTWGCNAYGQLGHGDRVDIKPPTKVRGALSKCAIEQVCCGANSTVAVDSHGRVFTWGSGMYGQLGHGNLEDYLEPTMLQDLTGTDVSGVAAGDFHMFAITENGVYAWGLNGCSQLGLGHQEDVLRPCVVDTLRGSIVHSISCGAAHSIAILSNINEGLVYVWGSNANGQLGLNKQQQEAYPTPIFNNPTLPPMAAAFCGPMHTILLTKDGDAWAAGNNLHGQLAQGNRSCVYSFKPITFFDDKDQKIVTMGCGGQNTVFLVHNSDKPSTAPGRKRSYRIK